MDIARAREALQDLLKSPNSTTSTRYYVKLALSHLQSLPSTCQSSTR